MSRIRAKDSLPELLVRKALFSKGFRYRVHDKRLPGKPDLVLPKYKTVIFVHGCFWHRHTGCSKAVLPKSNTDYWLPKIEKNLMRDNDQVDKLTAKGWKVIVVWECRLNKKNIDLTIDAIAVELLSISI